MERLEHSVKKILKAKYKVGLKNKKDIQQVNNENSFNNPSFRALKQKLVENIPTLIKNSNSIIPLNLKQNKILNIRFGNANGDELGDGAAGADSSLDLSTLELFVAGHQSTHQPC